MSEWVFWNIIALGAALILIALFFAMRGGSHKTDQVGARRTTSKIITLFLTFVTFIVISLIMYRFFG